MKIEKKFRPGGGVTLIGGAPCESADVATALSHAPHLVAADGGADRALEAGLTPALVIGDFDSISDAARAALPPERLQEVVEQQSTDFEKCLSRIDAPLIVGVGFLGGRSDHGLAALSVLAQSSAPCVLLGPEDAVFAAPRKLVLDLPVGTRLSLFPMTHVAGISTGLEWTIDGIAFHPLDRIGTSNRVIGPVRLGFDSPGMLVLLPKAQLAAAIVGLTG